MVAITVSVNGSEHETHVSCGPCWWGEDVATEKAVQIATEHEALPAHIAAEGEERDFELLVEAVRDQRGY